MLYSLLSEIVKLGRRAAAHSSSHSLEGNKRVNHQLKDHRSRPGWLRALAGEIIAEGKARNIVPHPKNPLLQEGGNGHFPVGTYPIKRIGHQGDNNHDAYGLVAVELSGGDAEKRGTWIHGGRDD